jgi:hypothetical protein
MPKAQIMLELGAYWGHYSMWLKKQIPAATVILVEPDANNLAAGRLNFKRNGFDGEFIQAAVAPGQFEVDAFLKARGIGHLDILHCDIQGYEVDMLAGGCHALGNGHVDYVLISTHSQDIHTRIIRGLTDFGFRVEVESDFANETTSYDGFVFASRQGVAPVFTNLKPLGRTGIARSRPQELLDSLQAVRLASRPA